MLKSTSLATATLVLSAACFVLLAPGQRVEAQSAGMYVNSVDLDILPAERDNFLAALKENGVAAVFGPGTSLDAVVRFIRENVKAKGVEV